MSAGQSLSPDYNATKQEIARIKANLLSKNVSEDSISSAFTLLLTNKLIPHWLGTVWTFEGHTNIPNEGSIACGYFVSTTLLHMGLNINRYRFAQQLPIKEAKTLALGQDLIFISNSSFSERITILKNKLPDGIHFIGFDQHHVGYIQKINNELYIIHSNYINGEGVIKEKVEDSEIFEYYSRLHIALISTNSELLRRWCTNTPVPVIMD